MAIQSHSVAIMAAAPLIATIVPSSWVASLANGASPRDQGFEAFPAGGNPGYSYAWSLISATGLAFVGGTSSKTCTVRATGSDSVASGTLRCTVTDALSATFLANTSIAVTFGTPP